MTGVLQAERPFSFEGRDYIVRAIQTGLGDVEISLWDENGEVAIPYPKNVARHLRIVLPLSPRMAAQRQSGTDLTALELETLENDFKAIVIATRKSDKQEAGAAKDQG